MGWQWHQLDHMQIMNSRQITCQHLTTQFFDGKRCGPLIQQWHKLIGGPRPPKQHDHTSHSCARSNADRWNFLFCHLQMLCRHSSLHGLLHLQSTQSKLVTGELIQVSKINLWVHTQQSQDCSERQQGFHSSTCDPTHASQLVSLQPKHHSFRKLQTKSHMHVVTNFKDAQRMCAYNLPIQIYDLQMYSDSRVTERVCLSLSLATDWTR